VSKFQAVPGFCDHVINLCAKGEMLIEGDTKQFDCSLSADSAIVHSEVTVICNSFSYCL